MIDANRLHQIFMDCLFREGEQTEPRVIGTGILHDFGFHPERLDGYENEIAALLLQLPKEFQEQGGGGWTFLNACVDKDGNNWGEQASAEQLLALGCAIGRAKILMAKKFWDAFPGGVPYFVVLENKLPGPGIQPLGAFCDFTE